MMKRIFYVCILVFCAVCMTYAQADPFFVQQTNIRGLYNPAATGKGGDINASLSVRQQWVGFQGVSTQALKFSSFAIGLQSGLGVTCIIDAFGPQRSNNIKLNYAYYVPFDDVAILSLGLGMGIMHSVYKADELFGNPIYDPDPYIPTESQTKTSPDFDIGLEFNTRHFEIGGAVTHVHYSRYDQNLVRPLRNFYSYSRIKFPINNYWDFIPGITWHNVRKSNTFELNVAFRHNNNFCVNLVYRNPMNTGIALGINLMTGFRLMYSYDYGFSNIGNYNRGTHELTIAYNIPMNTTYIQNKLRFFRWRMF